MGWGLCKKKREEWLGPCTLQPKKATKVAGRRGLAKRMKSPKLTRVTKNAQVEWPQGKHTVIVDVAAAARSVVHAGETSAMIIAKHVHTRATVDNPTSVVFVFDSFVSKAYPPQRAALHETRYAGKHLDYDAVAGICKLLNIDTPKDVHALDLVSRPLLSRMDLPWQQLFLNKDFKQFAFRLIATALRYTAVDRRTAVDICLPSATHRCVVDGTGATHVQKEVGTEFGEGDLRVWHVGLSAMKRGENVDVHSIDTDFLLMVMASVHLAPPTSKLVVTLKSGRYDGRKLIRMLLGPDASLQHRLNRAFWAMAFGTDYSNPLTHNGYYTKGLMTLLQPDSTANPLTVSADGKSATFCLREALRNLGTLKSNAKKQAVVGKGKDSVTTTLKKMLFCLQYYGLMFVATPTSLFPPAVILTPTQTYTFSIAPDAAIIHEKQIYSAPAP